MSGGRASTVVLLSVFLLFPTEVWSGEEAAGREALLQAAKTPDESVLVFSSLGEYEKVDAQWAKCRADYLEGGVERNAFITAALEYFLGLFDRGHYDEAGRLAASLREQWPDEPFFIVLALIDGERRGDKDAQYKLAGYFFDLYNERLFERENPDPIALCSVARGVFRENADSAREAFRLLQDLRGKAPGFLPGRWFAAEVSLEYYHWRFARDALETLLKDRPYYVRALIALAHLDFMESKYTLAEEHAQKALALNPRSAAAMSVIARLAYAEEDDTAALGHAERALAINSLEIPSLAVKAAVKGTDLRKPTEKEKEQWDRFGNRLAELYHAYAETVAMRRRFAKAVEFEREAVRLDRDAWWAYYGAGVNLLRLGEEEKALEVLKRSFELNPFNLWAYNLLNVLERDYEEGALAYIPAEGFLLKVPRKEETVYGRLLKGTLEGVFREYEKRWGMNVKGPAAAPGPLVEVLPDHEDFSVRSVGLPNLGALGVCFGQVVVCPSAQVLAKRFNSSYIVVLRHEVSHAFTLQKTDYSIPRWLTEGIAMHDEGLPEYQWDTLLLYAVAEDVDISLTRLNRYFGRPEGRRDVELAYAISYFVLGWMEKEWGRDAVDKMVVAYAQHGANAHEQAVRDALGFGIDQFEARLKKALAEYVQKEVPFLPPVNEAALERARAKLAEDPNDREAIIVLIRGLWAAGNMAEVKAALERAYSSYNDDPVVAGLYGQYLLDDGKDKEALDILEKSLKVGRRFWNLFLAGAAAARLEMRGKAAEYLAGAEKMAPHYVSPQNPAGEPLRLLLAKVLRAEGRKEEARAALLRQLASTTADIEAARTLADWALEDADENALERALERIVQVDPFLGKYRLERARLLRKRGRQSEAFYEYRAAALLLDEDIDALREWVDTGLDLGAAGRLSKDEATAVLEATRKLRAKSPNEPLLKRRAENIELLKGIE